ncbi:MAG: hypothetical protein GY820_23540 [Gammaproteobacteria bacterium]|nr:hypothetical protein [Gammaproteobacteria bacterium]
MVVFFFFFIPQFGGGGGGPRAPPPPLGTPLLISVMPLSIEWKFYKDIVDMQGKFRPNFVTIDYSQFESDGADVGTKVPN